MPPPTGGPIFGPVIGKKLDERTDRDRTADGPRESAPLRIGVPLLPFIDGEPSGGRGGQAALVDPSTGEPFACVAHAGPEDVERAVDAAVRGLALWRGTAVEERGQHLRALSGLIYESAEEIAELIAREQGKPRAEALAQEVLPALDHLKFIIRHASATTPV